MFKTTAMFEAISHAAQDAIIMINNQGDIIYWNPAAERIFGYTPQEAYNKNVHHLLAPEQYISKYSAGFSNFQSSGEGVAIGKTLEFTAYTKNRAIIYIELSVSAIKLEGEWQAIAIIRDITDRKTKDQQLLEYKERLQTVYDSIVDGLSILDLHSGKFVNVNSSFCSMFAYSEEELKKLGLQDLHPEEEMEKIYQEFQDRHDEKKFISNNIPCIRKDGTIFYTDIVDRSIKYHNRPCIIAFYRDITERRKTEKIKENFIATLSHDLRVPLLAEKHTLQYFLKGSYGHLTEKQIEAAINMLQSNTNLLSLVSTLLDVYKYESSKMLLVKDFTDIACLINETIKELSPLFQETHKQIVSEIPTGKYMLNVDSKEIKRVLMNIITNSLENSGDDCLIKIASYEENNFLNISISDNGRGIPDEDREKIFNLYYSSVKKFRKVGTGLGLYLSRQIIENHGGNIQVKSVANQGTTMTFSLPFES